MCGWVLVSLCVFGCLMNFAHVSANTVNRNVFISSQIVPSVNQFKDLKSCFCLYKVLMSQKTDVKWSTMLISLFLFPSCLFRTAYRFSEAKWWSGAGALPGRYLPLCHHLSGLSHAHPACPAGGGLRLCEAAASGHLPQPGLHGTAAAV